MKRSLLLCSLLSVYASAQFTGPGVNTHGQLLPVKPLLDIGVRWVRSDLPVNEVNESRVREYLNWYKGIPVLWILSQKTPNAPDTARLLRLWGVKYIEVGNEVDIPSFSPDGKSWSALHYGTWFKSIRKALGYGTVKLFGPSLSHYDESWVTKANRYGMTEDVFSIHGYEVSDMVGFTTELAKRWKKPVIVTEVGVEDRSLDPGIWYTSWKMQMGNRPWCWYDGPQTDWRGLFNHGDADAWNGWSKPTTVYNTILKSLAVAN